MKKLYAFEVRRMAEQFVRCRNLEDLRTIGFDSNEVVYNAMQPKYYQFKMRKKNGGFRKIEAPDEGLKQIQRQFNVFLQSVYYTIQSPASFGYIIGVKDEPPKKNILENARRHLGARYMLNADFKNFFHQVSNERILNLLCSGPFRFDTKTAEVLTGIFTYKKRLPMGAPTSPAWSNIVALPLDTALSDWAAARGLVYTRFVDDMTFSSKEQVIGEAQLEAINRICEQHGLKLNPSKTKIFGEHDLKRVTGLLLRETIDIDPAFYRALDKDLKRLRRMAEVSLIMNRYVKDPGLHEFRQEVDGQINFIGTIEGYDSPVFYKYRKRRKRALQPDEGTLSARWTYFNYL